MATAAEAAHHFVTGPQVIQAARLLLDNFPLVTLCQALVNARPEDAEHLLNALGRLAELEELHASFLSDEMVVFLQQGAQASDEQIRALVAKLLKRLAEGDEANTTRLAGQKLLDSCEDLLVVEESDTSEAAGKTLCAACRWQAGRDMLLGAGGDPDEGLAARLQDRLRELPESQRIRVLHLFVQLGQSADELFVALEQRGVFKEVLASFFTDDILLKLNAVELMDALGSFPSGQGLLTQQNIPEQLANELLDPMCDDSVQLCIVRLLGLVLRRAPAMVSRLLPGREAPLAQTIARLLESTDPVPRLCALNSWANISTCTGGLGFFLLWEGRLQTLVAMVSSSQNEVCKGAMAAWALVLEDRPPPLPATGGGGGGPAAAEALERMLWQVAENQLLPLVLKNLNGKPFADVRFHVWHLLALLVQSRAAAQQAVPSAELRDLLLDFTSETNSDARMAKHAFVVAVVRHHSAWLHTLLPEEVMDILEEYGRQGPHWVPRSAAAMVGDQSGA